MRIVLALVLLLAACGPTKDDRTTLTIQRFYLLAAACGQPPEKEMQQAQAAIDEARTEGAERSLGDHCLLGGCGPS